MEHGLKDIAFYVQKHITLYTVVITSLLVCDKLLGAPASVKRVSYNQTVCIFHGICSFHTFMLTMFLQECFTTPQTLLIHWLKSFISTLKERIYVIRGVTIHLVMIWFALRYTACNTLHDTIFAIHISDILFIQKLFGEDWRDRIHGWISNSM